MFRCPSTEYFAVALVLVTSLAQFSTAALQPHHTEGVIVVTDDNFDELTASSTSPWIISIGAPWCPHCVELAPIMEQLATQLRGKVNIGKIDGTIERVLLQRFNVKAFPSIYHLTGSECREYVEPRTAIKLLKFAEGGWRGTAPIASLQSPTSSMGRFLGALRMQPRRFQLLYIRLSTTWGLSNLSILALMLLIPIAAGIAVICVVDHVSRRPSLQRRRAAAIHQHFE